MLLGSLALSCATFQMPTHLHLRTICPLLIASIAGTSLITPYDFHPCNSSCLAVSKLSQHFSNSFSEATSVAAIKFGIPGGIGCLDLVSLVFFLSGLWLVVLGLLHLLSLRWCRFFRIVPHHRRSSFFNLVCTPTLQCKGSQHDP